MVKILKSLKIFVRQKSSVSQKFDKINYFFHSALIETEKMSINF